MRNQRGVIALFYLAIMTGWTSLAFTNRAAFVDTLTDAFTVGVLALGAAGFLWWAFLIWIGNAIMSVGGGDPKATEIAHRVEDMLMPPRYAFVLLAAALIWNRVMEALVTQVQGHAQNGGV